MAVGFGVAAPGVEVRRTEPVAGALAVDPAEQRTGRALPRQLRELVGRGDHQIGKEPIDLLVDPNDGNPFSWRSAEREWASAFGVTADNERAPQVLVRLGVLGRIEF